MEIGLVHFNHLTSDNLTKWPDMRISHWKPNYGDMLVCAAIVRQLGASDGIRVGFGGVLDRKVDRAIVRGSTYLHKHFKFEDANRTLDSIDAPLAIVGLGAQNPTADVSYLDNNAGARDFIARLNEKSSSLSVRGEFTAAVVERLGGQEHPRDRMPVAVLHAVLPRYSSSRNACTTRAVGGCVDSLWTERHDLL